MAVAMVTAAGANCGFLTARRPRTAWLTSRCCDRSRRSSASSERRPAARASSRCSRSTKYSTAEMAAIPSVTKSHHTAASYERPFIRGPKPHRPRAVTPTPVVTARVPPSRNEAYRHLPLAYPPRRSAPPRPRAVLEQALRSTALPLPLRLACPRWSSHGELSVPCWAPCGDRGAATVGRPGLNPVRGRWCG